MSPRRSTATLDTLPQAPASARRHGVAADSDTEDYALLCRVVAGDPEAFAILYRRYTPRLTAYLRPWLGSSDLVDDVIHDVWLIVWRRAIQFRGQSRVSTWLFGIARRQAHKTWVAHLRTPPSALSADATESDAPEVSLDRQERERSVARALAMLPRHERQVIEFAYYHAYTSQDIAAHLGCSVDTVKTHLSRARRHLAIQLTRRDQRSRTVLLSASPTAQTLWHDSGKRCGQRQPQSHT